MRLPQHFINRAFELHSTLVESYKTLNQSLIKPTLSDVERPFCYDAHFSRCDIVKAEVKEIINTLQESQTLFCCHFFDTSNKAIHQFLSIVYDKQHFEAQEEIRQQRDSLIKKMPTPAALYADPNSCLDFNDNTSLSVHNRSKKFFILFQKLIEKNKDYLVEKEMLAKINAMGNNASLTSDEKSNAALEIKKNTHFQHPLFLNKYKLPASEPNSSNSTPRK